MDLRMFGFDHPLVSSLNELFDIHEEMEKPPHSPSRAYVREAKAMASTPADVKEYPNAYVFVIDMPGLKSSDIKVHVEDERVLVVIGQPPRREEEKEGMRYVRKERRVRGYMRKFVLPENANTDSISAVCHDGLLTITVEKVPPPEPKKPKTIEVQGGASGEKEREVGVGSA